MFLVVISLSVLIAINSFYLIYLPLLLLIFFNKNIFSKLKKIFFSLVFLYSVLFVSFVFLYSFLNSGCIVYPANFSCFDHLSWSFNEKLIIQVNQWYELWAKAGATPNYVVEDRATYISKFNWFPNWIDNYFFNKVSDFLLGISFLILIFYTFFRSKSKFERHKFQFNKYLFLYIFLILVFSEWFIKHPSLRYGGYQVIALLLFIPLCSYISKSNINFKDFKKKALVLLLITIVVFVSRNITRLVKENKLYKYNPIQNTNYNFNKELHLRYYNHLIKNKINYKYLNFFGKKFLITVAPK